MSPVILPNKDLITKVQKTFWTRSKSLESLNKDLNLIPKIQKLNYKKYFWSNIKIKNSNSFDWILEYKRVWLDKEFKQASVYTSNLFWLLTEI